MNERSRLQSDKVNSRESYIDYLKVLGLFCLFLAHVGAPSLLHELRGFDVPFLVFISGYLAVPSLGRKTSSLSYLIKRILRLVVPSWIFLCAFYLCMVLVGVVPSPGEIIRSFLFQRNSGLAGGVWIIWVYIACAVMVPALSNVYVSRRFYVAVAGALFANEVLLRVTSLDNNPLLYYTLFTFVPYGCVLALGMRFRYMSSVEKIVLAAITALTHIGLTGFNYLANGSYLPLDSCKYPPSLYYLTYSIPITILLMSLFRRSAFANAPNLSIEFISRHSLWIYLWQILVGCAIKYVFKIDMWFVNLLLLVIASVLITWLQVSAVSHIKRKFSNPLLEYLL